MINNSSNCTFCQDSDIRVDFAQGYSKCMNCGCIYEGTIFDSRPNYEEQPSYYCGPMNNLNISNNNNSKVKTTKTIENYDQSVELAMREIRKYVAVDSINKKVIPVAEEQFGRLRELMETFQGYNMEHVAVAVLYASVLILQLPYSFKKLCALSGFAEEKINRVYKAIKPYCDKPDLKSIPFSQRRDVQLLQEHCKKLNLSKEITSQAENNYKKIIDGFLLSGHPGTNIGVAIYASTINSSIVSLEKISEVVDKTSKTIIDNYQKISETLKKAQ